MAIAAHRCDELLPQADTVTLWRLSAEHEDRFDACWDGWLDHHAEWRPFFETVARLQAGDVIAATTELGLVTADEIKAFRALKAAPDGRGLSVGKSFNGGRRRIALLALGFLSGRASDPVVPFVRARAS